MKKSHSYLLLVFGFSLLFSLPPTGLAQNNLEGQRSSERNQNQFSTPPSLQDQTYKQQAYQETNPVQPPSPPIFDFPQEETSPAYSLSTCRAQKDSIETDQGIVWSYKISGAYVVARWSGETLSGATEREVSTSYARPGLYAGNLAITRYDNSVETIACGSVRVTPPPLSLQCSPSDSFVTPGSCVTWSVDITSSNDIYAINWSGHQAVDPQTNERFDACYPQAGSYLADVEVSTLDESRTIYCGSVTVMDNPPRGQEPTTRESSTFSLSPGENLEGYCSANLTETRSGSLVTWKAHMNKSVPHQSLIWSGETIKNRTGDTQKVSYDTPGEYSASISVRTDQGYLYTFPCSNSVSIIEQSDSSDNSKSLFWIRFILVTLLITIWIPVVLHLWRKKK